MVKKIFVEATNKHLEIFKEISDLTLGDYEIKGNFISVESLLDMIFDLLNEVHIKEELLEDMEQDIQDNYKRISISEQVGISDKDFI